MNTYNVTIQVTGDDSHEAMDKVRVIERILDQAADENLFYIYDDSEQFHFDLTVNPAPNPEQESSDTVSQDAIDPEPYRFRNYKGDLVEAPSDYSHVVQSMADGLIVWSRTTSLGFTDHQVRYGLEVNHFTDEVDAAHNFGECIYHNAVCEGHLD